MVRSAVAIGVLSVLFLGQTAFAQSSEAAKEVKTKTQTQEKAEPGKADAGQTETGKKDQIKENLNSGMEDRHQELKEAAGNDPAQKEARIQSR